MADHWLNTAKRQPSPNRDDRSDPDDVSLLVIHCVSLPAGEYGTGHVVDLFLNRLDLSAHSSFADLEGVEVSSHFLIERDGGLVQFVPTDQRAWHAGVSTHHGRERCNDFSIGIELEGVDDAPFETWQYDTLSALLVALVERYPRLGAGSIVGHAEIAPFRKTDPGRCFDWSRVLVGVARACR